MIIDDSFDNESVSSLANEKKLECYSFRSNRSFIKKERVDSAYKYLNTTGVFKSNFRTCSKAYF